MLRFSLVISFLSTLSSCVIAQSIARKYYNELFPNNKYVRLEYLKNERDSLELLEDSLIKILIERDYKLLQLQQENDLLKKERIAVQTESLTLKEILGQEINKLTDSIVGLSFGVVTCKEEIIRMSSSDEDPTMVNTCLWNKYKLIETGTPDKKGNYSWRSELFVDQDTLSKPVEYLFEPDQVSALELIVNSRLKEDFGYLLTQEKHCFSTIGEYPGYKLNQMRIGLHENGTISFEVSYGLTNSCEALDLEVAIFKIEELKPYFRK